MATEIFFITDIFELPNKTTILSVDTRNEGLVDEWSSKSFCEMKQVFGEKRIKVIGKNYAFEADVVDASFSLTLVGNLAIFLGIEPHPKIKEIKRLDEVEIDL